MTAAKLTIEPGDALLLVDVQNDFCPGGALAVERGNELGRLIPAELVALHHPGLRADFKRRLLEGEVLQYRLREDEQKGKGPMVVCIDVSSSMQGDKEQWAKAVSRRMRPARTSSARDCSMVAMPSARPIVSWLRSWWSSPLRMRLRTASVAIMISSAG